MRKTKPKNKPNTPTFIGTYWGIRLAGIASAFAQFGYFNLADKITLCIKYPDRELFAETVGDCRKLLSSKDPQAAIWLQELEQCQLWLDAQPTQLSLFEKQFKYDRFQEKPLDILYDWEIPLNNRRYNANR